MSKFRIIKNLLNILTVNEKRKILNQKMSVKYDIVELSKGHYIKLLKCFSTPLDEVKNNSLIVIIPGIEI